MSFELHNKKKYDFERKDMTHILYLEWHFCYMGRYGGDFMDKYGSRYLDTSLCLCFYLFLFSWPLERYNATSMHHVRNDTCLLMNYVTQS
jgi:hypothetical protein